MKKSFKPYRFGDLKFAMGNVLEEWARSIKSNEKMTAAKEMYIDAYREEFGLEEGSDINSIDKPKADSNKWRNKKQKKRPLYDDWISSHETWCNYAVQCCLASDYILAVDYYKKAIELAEKKNRRLMKKYIFAAVGNCIIMK